jgi:rhodanese-related sulfurtransferase
MLDHLRPFHFLLLLAALSLVGCPVADDDDDAVDDDDTVANDDDTVGDDDDSVVDELDLLMQHMAAEDLDLPALLSEWIIAPNALFDAGVANYFVMDIRTGDVYFPGTPDFEDGHIAGAHSVPLADVVTYEAANNTEDLPVVVVCYTGQTAGHAVAALRLSGVPAKVLKWGMSGWHSDFDLWSGKTGDASLDYPGSWNMDAPPALLDIAERPVLDTGATDGAGVLHAMVDQYVLGGFNKIGAADVLGAPDDFQVINYWAQDDWDHYGHIDGAYQVAPGDLTLDTLSLLDPSQSIVIYCWTGQTGSMVAAWLNVLGYDAVDLTFGANTMIYDDLESHKWSASMDYAVETGS